MIGTYVGFTISDCIEVLFFSSMCYYFTLWLNKDRQKNLLLYFYGYCLLAIGAYYTNLSTIAFFLFAAFPAAIMVFIIVHQDILQRNFVALHNISINNASLTSNLWHEMLVRSCLVLSHKQKSVICVIEQQSSLQSFIETTFIFDTPMQHGLLESLLQNQTKKNAFVLLSSQGILKSIESSWVQTDIQKNDIVPYWQQEALFFTSKTDALVIRNNPQKNTFCFIAQGKNLEGLTADQLVRILQKYSQKSGFNQGFKSHGYQPQEHHSPQSGT